MIHWVRSLWWAQQRRIDLRILWPACKAQAHDLNQARAAFMVHALQDPAWVRHYGGQLWNVVRDLN